MKPRPKTKPKPKPTPAAKLKPGDVFTVAATAAVNPPTRDPLAIEWWPIGRPKPYPKNARKLSDRAF